MRNATMRLLLSDEQGSVSEFRSDSELTWMIQELPDRQNARNRSRINPGEYVLDWRESPSHGWCYRVMREIDGKIVEVEGHDHVLMHIGNLAGDVEMGYASDSEACLLPGMTEAVFAAGAKVGHHVLTKPQRGVTGSGTALHAIEEEFRRERFKLTIIR